MIEYKTVDFYNEYFRNIDGFSLVEEFSKMDHKYVGKIKADKVLHTPCIEVEIPINFPHRPLLFWTDSLAGYPHLIRGVMAPGQNDIYSDRSWFCLNTPFAETAESQLYHELSRLKGWFDKFLNPNLPAKIEDPKVINSLHICNLLEWENPDEMKEMVNDCGLTFVGDFAENPDCFKEFGYLHCRKTEDRFRRFHLYAYKDKGTTNLEVPYVIVNDFCGKDNLDDFLKMRQYYQWNSDLQEKLLPDFGICQEYSIDDFSVAYYDQNVVNTIKANRPNISIDPKHTKVIDQCIEKISSGFEGFDPLDLIINMDPQDPRYEDWCERQMILQQSEDDAEKYQYGWNYFAVGFKENGTIIWYLFWTKRILREYENVPYCFGHYMVKQYQHPIDLTVRKLSKVPLNWYPADRVNEKRYFGRGAFDRVLRDKKIAIIGAGAIGSFVATSLVRGGVKNIGIWDGDTVEPGNLCRSIYSNGNVGENKAVELAKSLKKISPFCEVSAHSYDLYGNINYQSQEDVQKALENFEVIIDCTASNELLHYLSYSMNENLLLSICITNRSQNLLCISNADGNPFEIRKAYLAKIVQDTRNYYVEGTGCYSPTFLATNSDIAALVNMAVRGINKHFENKQIPRTYIYSYDARGVVADCLYTYQLSDGLSLIISKETLLDIEEMQDSETSVIGILYGCYSYDGRTIFITHCIPEYDMRAINDILYVSQGVIDYVGEYRYSTENDGEYSSETLNHIKELSIRENINTNNPLLALRNTNGSTTFYLYIDGQLEEMKRLQS